MGSYTCPPKCSAERGRQGRSREGGRWAWARPGQMGGEVILGRPGGRSEANIGRGHGGAAQQRPHAQAGRTPPRPAMAPWPLLDSRCLRSVPERHLHPPLASVQKACVLPRPKLHTPDLLQNNPRPSLCLQLAVSKQGSPRWDAGRDKGPQEGRRWGCACAGP